MFMSKPTVNYMYKTSAYHNYLIEMIAEPVQTLETQTLPVFFISPQNVLYTG